ncbi:hypothetical protein [Dactylosporangium sp. CA-139066]|uniref:hypothetical protein n=1 Tax=Dactylosporangium sp. CA-139066 TaxID=3239930 RepID=UPI003D8AD473
MSDPERRRMMAALQAWHMEWAAKWKIDEWEGNIPPEAEAEYQRRADEIRGIARPAPAPFRIPDGMAPIPIEPRPRTEPEPEPEPEPDAPATPPLARTSYESLFYVDTEPCPRCGVAMRTRWSSAMIQLGDGLGDRYSGDCGNCGQHREYVFRLPERHLPRPSDRTVFFGGPDPSQLVDAGRWLNLWDEMVARAKDALAAGDAEAVRRNTELAWTAVDEALKFIPDGADAIPETAFWSPAGRRRYEREPRRFTRRRLRLLHDVLREEFGPPDWATPAGGPARPPLARSSAEAHLYLDRQACVCGAARANWSSSIRDLDGDLAGEYRAACPQCGRDRRFVFRLPPEPPPIPVEGAGFSYGDATRSELVDPGEWLAESDRLSRSVPMLPAAASAAERERFRFAIGRAAAALAEVARFAPPGATAVPEEACFTEAGRAVHRAEPGRFRLDRLAAVRQSYLHLLELAE